MSRCQPSVRTLPGLAMALAVLLAAGAAMAGDSAAVHPPQATATAVQTALRGIEGRLDRLQADITRAEHAAASPPGAFSRELEQLRWQVQDQTRRLVGLHWTVAGPVLSEANRLSGRADGLARRLENWQPSLPPDPSRPLKTSAATGTGTITGTLTDQSTGNPISYTRVEVYCPGSGFDAETMSGADGVYTMGGLDSGDCYVRTWNQQSYIDELYDDISCAAGCQLLDGTPVPVVDGEVTSGIDFILETAGAIRGTLTDAESGLPVTSAAVDLYDVSGSWVEGATTDAYGVYRLWELPAGTYFVRSDAPGDEYVNELYDDIACSSSCDPTTGTPVTVTPGQITTGIDFALEPTGAISGLVTESGSGDPICSSQLTAFDSTGTEIAMATSSCDGSYEIEGLPGGSYFVTATEASHRGQLYDGLPCYDSCDPTAGTPIQVGAGATTGDIDFALDPWPTPAVSGTVTDSVSGLPIGSGSVVLYDDQGDYAGSRQPDTDGQYVFGPLVPGTYFATATESTHLKELYQEIDCTYYCDPTDGTPITVGIGADAGGIDFTLEPESIIGGTVASVEGNPLNNVQVLVYDDSGLLVDYVHTNSLGQYEVDGLPASTFYAKTSRANPAYINQLYDGIECLPWCDPPTTGTPITTTAGATTQVSFSLTRFGSITGQITDAASGVSISDAEVRLYDSDGAPVDGGSDYSDSHGEYEIQGLLSGTYFLVVSDNAYHDELYDNLPCEGGCDVTTGTPIAITIGSDPVVIDIALDRMGSISGRVTDAFTGKGLHDKHVALYDSQGNWVHTAYSNFVNGFYSFVGLAEGTYFLTTKDIGGYLDELFDDIPCEDGCDVTTGTPVIVTDGADTSNIDFALEPIPRFADVPVGYWARYWIRTLSDTGITAGCATNPLRYCPEDPVARNQMAVFLLKSKLSPDYTPPPALGMFNDVPIGDPFAPWIEELAARGITAGCSADPPLFCPNAPLTRNQMAKFLLKTLEGPVYSPPPAVGVFDDVPADDPFAPWIEDLAARGITAGCSADPPLFCPNSPVSRAEMAVFLVKTFNLQVGGY